MEMNRIEFLKDGQVEKWSIGKMVGLFILDYFKLFQSELYIKSKIT